jgi:hypothetical protein
MNYLYLGNGYLTSMEAYAEVNSIQIITGGLDVRCAVLAARQRLAFSIS